MTKISLFIKRVMEDYDEDEFVIYDGDTDIGYAIVHAAENDEHPYVERIDIEEEYRNQGHGTNALYQLSAKYGGTIYLAPDNVDAKRLYERIGFDGYDWDAAPYVDQGYGVYKI